MQDKIASFRVHFFFIVVVNIVFWVGISSSVMAKKGRFSVRYTKPMITYLGMEGAACRGLDNDLLLKMEQLIRKEIETGRFIYIKLPMKSGEVHQIAQKMVKIVAKKSISIAKMRAEWNSQFQGFDVTSEMLEAIQNQSYFYWIKLSEITFQDVQPTWLKVLFGGPSLHYLQARIKGSLFIHKLHIFDCRPSNRQKSPLHRRFCRGKRDSDIAGFSKPFKKLNIDTEWYALPFKRKRKALLAAAQKFGQLAVKEMTKLPDFQIHAPIMKADLGKAYIPLGKSENIKLNQGFKVYVRGPKGKLLYRGYARVRSIGDNRLKLEGHRKVRVNPNAPLFSTLQPLIVAGDIRYRKGMMAYESLSSGFSSGFYVGMASLAFDLLDRTTAATPSKASIGMPDPLFKDNFLSPLLQFDFIFDISHSSGINEFYFTLLFELLFSDFAPEQSFIFPATLSFGLTKKFFFRQLALNLGFRLGLSTSISNKYRLTVGGEVFTGLELLITPSFSFVLNLAMKLHFPIFTYISPFGPALTFGGYYTF